MATSPGPVSVAASLSSVSGAAANSLRNGLMVFNNSTGNLFLTYGASSATTLFTVKIAPGGYWEMPYAGDDQFDYVKQDYKYGEKAFTGAVSLIWDSFTAGDHAFVTETSEGQ